VAGVYTALIIDACHSGSIDRDIRFGPPEGHKDPRFVPAPFDIRCRADKKGLKNRAFGRKRGLVRDANENVHFIDQRHILLSGCRDDQTSADAFINNEPCGAMTWAFLFALDNLGFYEGKQPSWINVHAMMLHVLSTNGYSQIPQLTGPEDMLNGPVFGEF
jgi:hypothetical protein